MSEDLPQSQTNPAPATLQAAANEPALSTQPASSNATGASSDSEDARALEQTTPFLARTAELLHRYGTPSYRLERVMQKVAENIGVTATVLYTPTALVMSIRRGRCERTLLRRVTSGDVDVSKLLAFDQVLDQLASGQLAPDAALQQLEAAAEARPAFSAAVTTIAAGVACGSVAVIFGGGLYEIVTATLLGLVIAGLSMLSGPLSGESGLLEPVAGFSVAVLALLTAQYIVPLDDRLVTLAALILPVPGLTLTVALTELTLGHLSSGSARLAGAGVRLITLVMGVALAWNIMPDGMHPPGWAPYVVGRPIAEWSLWIALALAPAAFGVLFRVPASQWPYVFLVSIGGFLTNQTLDASLAPAVGSFCGALVVGCGSNLYARWKNRPAMTLQTPGLLILVPGSLGYRSLTALLESETIRGIELAFAMVLAAGSLVGGLLVANLCLPPKRIL